MSISTRQILWFYFPCIQTLTGLPVWNACIVKYIRHQLVSISSSPPVREKPIHWLKNLRLKQYLVTSAKILTTNIENDDIKFVSSTQKQYLCGKNTVWYKLKHLPTSWNMNSCWYSLRNCVDLDSSRNNEYTRLMSSTLTSVPFIIRNTRSMT